MLALTPDHDRFWCECGHPKSQYREACGRCVFLDGRLDGLARIEGLVIAALRGTDGLSLTELCEAVYGPESARRDVGAYRSVRGSVRNSELVMLRLTQRLMARGRLRRYWQDGDPYEVEIDLFGQGRLRLSRMACPGRWVYVLCDAQRRAA